MGNQHMLLFVATFIFMAALPCSGISDWTTAPSLAPTPSPTVSVPTPAPIVGSPTPSPTVSALTPAPIVGSPTPSPTVSAPTPAPIVGSPTPSPLVGSPTPSPLVGSPTPVPTGSPNSEACMHLLLDMASCVSYVSKGSTVSKPDQNCCYGLEVVLDIDARCICDAWENSAHFGIDLDVQRALSLPSACQVLNAPSVDQCGVALSPVPSASPNVPTPTPISISPFPKVILPSPGPSNWRHAEAPAPTPIGTYDDVDSASASLAIGPYYIMLAFCYLFVNFLALGFNVL